MGLTVIKPREQSLIREELYKQKNSPRCGYLQFIMNVVTERYANPTSLFPCDTIEYSVIL
jgi:hypothetical protein